MSKVVASDHEPVVPEVRKGFPSGRRHARLGMAKWSLRDVWRTAFGRPPTTTLWRSIWAERQSERISKSCAERPAMLSKPHRISSG